MTSAQDSSNSNQSNTSTTETNPSDHGTMHNAPNQQSNQSLWGAMFGAVAGATGAVGGAAMFAGGAVAGAAGAVGNAAVQAGSAVTGTAVGVAGAVGNAAVQAGSAVTETAVGAAGAVGNAAVQAGSAVTGTAVGVAVAVGNTAMQATDGLGYVLDAITNSDQLKELTKAVQVDWLITIIDKVDIVQAETHVKNLQKKYSNEKPAEIAHRVMFEKSLYVGSTGFASSLLPGFAATMFVVDLAATMALQAEMIYQIAAAYGLDLEEASRKGEVLAIFGMALGGGAALKAGLGFARNIPIAGAVIGASSNAAMLYTLGYAACRFYEAKNNPSSTVDWTESQAKVEDDLQAMLNQQVVMDQIVIHLVMAGKPKKKLHQLLPELQSLNLSQAALDEICKKPESLPPLEELLTKLNQNFGISLVARCYKIAHMDGVITERETKVMDTITEKFKPVNMG